VSLAMTRAEREAFLADLHVGVVSVAADGRGPLAMPIWYSYEPCGTVNLITGRSSRKTALIRREGRFSVCAQTEEAPYRYVTVEGPVVAVEDEVDPEERKAIAYRYLGQELGDAYLSATEADVAGSIVIRMRPERWLSVDYGKLG
jgi:nitroimidazol reductase NimA-like FMN-containing flavoprotein (pyridoxamine 5'-phosphate oxidase superfamily)